MHESNVIKIPELTYFDEIMLKGFFGHHYVYDHVYQNSATPVILMILGFFAAAVIAYIIGSMNIGIMLSKKLYNQDIRELGSKNAGATNMARVFGGKAGLLTIFGEFLKTGFAIVIGRLIMGVQGMFVAALFAVLGQLYPLFYGFRGGKGVAATGAVMLFTTPGIFLIELVIFAVIAYGTKFISLASIMAALMYPLLLNTIRGPGLHNLIALIIAVLVWVRHKENIKRLWSKEERKFDFATAFKSKRRQRKEAEAEELAALNRGSKNNGEDK
jgi:glycerol-3-phosphate acyltransferase PlsY